MMIKFLRHRYKRMVFDFTSKATISNSDEDDLVIFFVEL